jgi:hypothetical protein
MMPASGLSINLGESVDENQIKLLLAGIAVVGTILGIVAGAVANFITSRSTRRRSVYGAALPYRVARRGTGEEDALRERFHQLQEDLACHRGLIGSESKYVERSYTRLVNKVKADCRAPIKRAWGGALADDEAEKPTGEGLSPDISGFLRDVRCHLSPWPWRKVALWWSNRVAV